MPSHTKKEQDKKKKKPKKKKPVTKASKRSAGGQVATKGNLGPDATGRPNSQSNRPINRRLSILKVKPNDRLA